MLAEASSEHPARNQKGAQTSAETVGNNPYRCTSSGGIKCHSRSARRQSGVRSQGLDGHRCWDQNHFANRAPTPGHHTQRPGKCREAQRQLWLVIGGVGRLPPKAGVEYWERWRRRQRDRLRLSLGLHAELPNTVVARSRDCPGPPRRLRPSGRSCGTRRKTQGPTKQRTRGGGDARGLWPAPRGDLTDRPTPKTGRGNGHREWAPRPTDRIPDRAPRLTDRQTKSLTDRPNPHRHVSPARRGGGPEP